MQCRQRAKPKLPSQRLPRSPHPRATRHGHLRPTRSSAGPNPVTGALRRHFRLPQ
jgi:hypothetical protein